VSNQYYRTFYSSAANTAITHQRANYLPLYISKTTTVDRIAISTGSTFSGTATIRLGIYNESNGQPSTVLLDAGTVSATAASTNYEITISQSLSPGFYFLAFCQQGTAPTVASYIGATSSVVLQNYFMLGSTSPSTVNAVGYQQSSVTGAFATASSISISGSTAHVWVRAA
jgi:hypothetical protein